jgi:hypothetical protein
VPIDVAMLMIRSANAIAVMAAGLIGALLGVLAFRQAAHGGRADAA